MKAKHYFTAVRLSLPIFIGYFAVSFGFGALASAKGLSVWQAALISVTNLTSAGQYAGLTVIAAGAPLMDMILTQLVINSRYALMGLALSQKIGRRIGLFPRFFFAFHNTDEIFAVAMEYDKPLDTAFMLGLGLMPILGWTGGTVAGALLGSVLPAVLQASLAFAIYGMFAAIVVPPAKKSRPVLFVVLLAVLLSCLFRYLPLLNRISEGMAIVLVTLLASAVIAYFFPYKEPAVPEEKKKEEQP